MLHIHFGNRIEKLADALASELEAAPPAAALEPETIVVGHAGMDEWLKRALAERLGVAANLDFPLPASFVWRMLRAHNPELPKSSPLDRGPLVWRLFAALGEPAQSKEVANYLQNGDELSRFELAGELAKVFEQYQMYRPEWVLDWEAGKAKKDAEWQAALWRRVADAATPNPARLYRDFVRHADELSRDSLPARISIFGISAMPPVYLELFAALATTREIRFYVPSPSRAYWGDIESEKRLKRWRLTDPERAEYAMSGHNLLAALGIQSRDFIELLHGLEVEVITHDHFERPRGGSLLGRLQADMLELTEPRESVPGGDDESLLVHVCHSRRREVEVLHDALLAAFEADPGLGPEDILVMAPNMDDYADHVAAVFGAAPDARHVPWTLAERSLRAEHPLAEAMMTLLGLPDSRLKASEVLGLLDLPAVARRYELDDEALENIHRWVAEAGVRWAWDDAHRSRFDLPAEALFSWRFGLDRLLAGYALAPGDETAWDGIAPWGALEGQSAQALGALYAFAVDLNRWRGELAEPRTLAGWAGKMRELIGVFAPETPGEIGAVGKLQQAAGELEEQAGLARFDGGVSWTVARSAFAARLAVTRHPRPFLSGRVTFCALAPMRSIPAKFVWLLGMSEEDFPRHGRAPGFDLIAKHPRRGDRARHTEDRALFLEALCGARDKFQVSYIGRSERDNGDLPASVVVNALLDATGRMGAEPETRLVDHPLQPFSSRYEKEPRREASYAEEWLGKPRGASGDAPFATELEADEEEVRREIGLAELIAGLANPARRYLQNLGIARAYQEAPVKDEELFVLDGLARWRIEDELLRRWLGVGEHFDPAGCFAEFLARAWLPVGEAGRVSFDGAVNAVATVVEAVGKRTGWQEAGTLAVDLSLGRWHLGGTVADVYPDAGLVRARAGVLRPRDRLALWVEHLALCAANTSRPPTSSFHAGDETLQLGAAGDAEAQLERLCELYENSGRLPMPLLPDLSCDYIRRVHGKEPNDALDKVRGRWRGWVQGRPNIHVRGGEDFALVFRGVDEPIGREFERLAREVFGALRACEAES
ncbi:MAG: exodeoxyribonuclease V subunit gamma [Gammaproteobacteria bacterium]|nr:exodeoxyribonuclease V subunit gamma [Gammaproteobacteria bacterium]